MISADPKMFETIDFCLSLSAEFWDKPPGVTIFIDGDEKFSGEITANHDSSENITFSHTLRLHESHELRLYRTNKTLEQCSTVNGQLRDQLLFINGLSIDGIDVHYLIGSQSQFVPVYPEPWKSEQIAAGKILETMIIGENILGHNGTWSLTFTSPFEHFLFGDN